MRSRTREHIRSNLVGYLALFLVVTGGTAYAVDGPLPGVNQVGSEDIINAEVQQPDIGQSAVNGARIANQSILDQDLAPGTVKGSKILDDSVTGADVDESTLSGVNASQVDGLNAALIDHQTSDVTSSPVEVLNVGGLILRLECINTDFFEPRLVAATTVEDAMIRSRALPDFGVDEVVVITDDDFDTGAGDEKTLYDGSQGSGLINYRTGAGSNVTVQYMVDGIGTSVGGCTVSGTAFQGSP